MAKTVLVINSGSSSIKYQLVDLETGEGIASGLVEKIGEPVDGHYKHEYNGEKHELEEPIHDHEQGLKRVLGFFDASGPKLPDAGIVAVGARFPLVAFHINLSTSDVAIANKIAKTTRESSGGMRWVKSIGVMLEERNSAQGSINMTNHTKTPIYRVYETVRFEAARYGVQIIGSELIGIVPMDALVETAEYYLKLENFDKDNQVMEKHLL